MSIAETQRRARNSGVAYREAGSLGYVPDLDILVTFVRVADLGSFTKAAHALNRSQSTVSLHITRVEETYNCTVFHRTTKSVALTANGEVLLSFARRIIGLHEAARTRLHDASLAGLVRIGIMEDFAVRQLPQILRQFVESHPNVTLEIQTAVSAELMGGLEDGRLDIVLARRSEPEGRGEVIWREPLSWVMSRDHPLKQEGPLSLVVSAHGCYYRPLVIAALDASRLPWTISCTSTSLSGVCAAVYAGFGIGVLADSTIPPDLQKCPASFNLPELPQTEIALFRSRNASSALVLPIMTMLKEVFFGISARL